MGIVSRLAVNPVADRLVGATNGAVRQVLALRGPALARATDDLRARHPGTAPGRLARHLVADRARRVAGTGAASATPGMLPGLGTAAEIGIAIGDITLLTYTQVELILMLAHMYGRPLDDHEGRRLDVLLVMGVEAGAVRLRGDGGVELLGKRYRPEELRGAAIDDVAARVNRRLAAQVAARLARRRATVVLGRAVPLVGIGVAAGYNMWSTRKLGHAAIRYFEHLV